MRKFHTPLFAGLLGLATLTTAQAGALINLSAEASQAAPNDEIHATVYAEATGNNPAELAKRINRELGEALKVARGQPGISAKTGSQSTYPLYGQNQRIENWRMRAELVLESRDSAAISDLLGRLQQMKLAVGQVNQQVSRENRRVAEDAATREAIRAFESRARVIAEVFAKPYKIKQMNIQQNGGPHPMPIMRAEMAMAKSAADPIPLAAGESTITTTVSGQIELGD